MARRGWIFGGLAASAAGVAAWLARPVASPPAHAAQSTASGVRVIYSPGYRVSFFGLEKLHPFDIGKYDRIAQTLVDEGLLAMSDFGVPEEATAAELAEIHDATYLASLSDAKELSQVLEVPIPSFVGSQLVDERVLAPMRRAASGTVMAALAARDHGFAINIGGGFHHARRAMGHGFCVYNDVALAIHRLRAEGFDAPIAIVDTDVHQGDGNHDFFADDPTVTTLSLHQRGIFPQPPVPGDRDVELDSGTDDAAYLEALKPALDEVLASARPKLLVHVAGSDVLSDDPLASLALTPAGLVARDRWVSERVRGDDIHLVHVLAGGYGPSAATAQAQSLVGMMRAARS